MPARPSILAKRPAADAQEAAWVADEDRFVLQQSMRKSAIRAKSGRAAPIDWLAVTLAVIDPERNPLDDDLEDGDLELVAPERVFEGLGEEDLGELEKGIETYVTLEKSRSNLEYWVVSSWVTRSVMSGTNADRSLDDENHLPGPPKALTSSLGVRERRLIRRRQSRQAPRTKESRRA